ncbi:MAG: nitrogenase component 1 [Elusimicrobiota bacterium]
MTNADWSQRLNYPHLTGAMLAVNAIPDVSLLIDGPRCIQERVQEIFGRHDLNSTIFRDGGCYRIWHTDLETKHVVTDIKTRYLQAMRLVASRPAASRVVAAAMPMCVVTGTQYDLAVRSLPRSINKRIALLPAPAIGGGDWLLGFDQTLAALVATLELRKSKRRRTGTVALIGAFPHRMEMDEIANIAELVQLLEDIGLEVAAVWPSGAPWEQLARVASASAVISLPYGRAAGRLLAENLGAELIETELPFGLSATRRWLTHIGRSFGKLALARRVADARLRRTVPNLQWAVQSFLTGRRIACAGDSHILPGLLEMLSEFGCSVPLAVAVAESRAGELSAPLAAAETLYEPGMLTLKEKLRSLRAESKLDVLIANSEICALADSAVPVLEFGFPSYYSHALARVPYLGFSGAAAWVERLVRVSAQTQLTSLRNERGRPFRTT